LGVLADDSRYVREAILGRLMQARYTDRSGQVTALGGGGPQVASFNAEKSLDTEAMALGFANRGGEASPGYGPGIAFWTHGFGSWASFEGDKNAATADRDLGGFLSGMDARLGGTWRAGLAIGGSWSDVSVNARHSSANVESFHLAGYTGGMAGPFAFRGGGAWSWNDIDTSRAVIFPGFFERENTSYDADTGQVFGEITYPIDRSRSAFEPFAGLAFVSIETNGFRESGSLAGLRGSGQNQDVGYSTLGLRAATTYAWNGASITPYVSASWQHAFNDIDTAAGLAFASTSVGFAFCGVPSPRTPD
jgi:outer membrane autotransporter protein